MIITPKRTTHPSVVTATWTKVSAIPSGMTSGHRKRLILVNEDTTNVWRFEIIQPNEAVPTLATEGLPLYPNGGCMVEDYTGCSTGDVYAYQASGGALTSLAVQEAV